MKKLIFQAEDFIGQSKTTYADVAADKAQAKFDQWLASQHPIFSLSEEDKPGPYWQTFDPEGKAKWKGLLVNVERGK